MIDGEIMKPLEQWLPIAETNGKYMVSDCGMIRSLSRGRNKILAPVHSKGYLNVKVLVDGQMRHRLIHRLVASAFVANPFGLPEVNHKNGDKFDNRVSNLEWVNRSQNMRHRAVLPNARICERHPLAKLTNRQVLEIRRLRGKGLTLRGIAADFGVSDSTISYVTAHGWKGINRITLAVSPNITSGIPREFREFTRSDTRDIAD